MGRLAWKGFLHNKLRFVLTGLAVALATAFMAGALILGDTAESGVAQLVDRLAGSGDVVVRPEGGGDTQLGQAPEQTLDAGLVDSVAALDEVAEAHGHTQGAATLVGEGGDPIGGMAPTFALATSPGGEESLPVDLRRGRWPVDAQGVAVDAATVQAQGWQLGDEVTVAFDGPAETATLVGVVGVDGLDDLAGAGTVVISPDSAGPRLGTEGGYSSLVVRAAEGVDDEALAQAVRGEVGAGHEVLTAAEVAEQTHEGFAVFTQAFSVVPLMFAGIAVFVGAFLVFNTFNIVLAQRLRQLALLRAVGAGRGQLWRSALAEAGIVGLVAGIVGAAAGIGIAAGLEQVFAALSLSLPGEGLVVRVGPLLAAVAVAVGVTVVAAAVPARRAGRIPPVAAMHQVAVTAPTGSSRVRAGLGVTLLAAGVAGMAGGLFADAGLAVLGAGSASLVLGVAVLATFGARPLAGVVGWPAALWGTRGELARKNAMRQPRRTATTASALMVGLALVAFGAVFASSLRAEAEDTITDVVVADAFVRSPAAGSVPDSAVQALRELDETAFVAPARSATLSLAGDEQRVSVLEAQQLTRVFDYETVAGDVSRVAKGGGLIASRSAADEAGVAAGDEIAVEFADDERTLAVVAVVEDRGAMTAPWALDETTFADAGGQAPTGQVFVDFPDSVDTAQGLAAIDSALFDHPQLVVEDRAGLVDEIAGQVNQLLGAVFALLALSVLIALLGIVNTQALNVVERVRELGMLRAIGMTRRQVRAMVRTEAVIVSLLGAVLGLVLGVGFGWAVLQADALNIASLTIPWTQLGVAVMVAGLAGLLAGLLPARRAARLNVLDALRTE